jgi:hypothetical protein
MFMADLLSVALKEWELQIDAMLAGRQAFLLRKGGILESENEFELEHRRFLFFPTVVHQDPRMVKPEFRAGLRQEREEPDRVTIKAYGEAVKIFEVPRPTEVGRKKLESLSDLYVWDAPLLDMRFAYRPEKPLYLVVVRAFRLKAPVTIANTLAYAGCKSWVPLAEGPENVGVDVSGATPAVSETRVEEILERVRATFAG